MSDAEPDPEALARAAAQVRRLIVHLRKTKASRALLEQVEREVEKLNAELAPHDHPGPYAQAALDPKAFLLAQGGPPLHLTPAEFFPYSPIVGPRNPLSPLVVFERQADAIVAKHVFDAPWNGPPGSVHGGVIALVFDELLGCIGAVSDVGGFTGTLKVVYRSLTPVGREIRMRAWIDRVEGVKSYIKGTMHCDFPAPDTLCAEAEGIFIRPKRALGQDALERTGNG